MSVRSGVDFAFTAVLTVCAVAITAAVVRREFFPRHDSGPAQISRWRDLASGPMRIGPSEAPVTIIEFGDFECPYCREFAATTDSLFAKYPGKIGLVFRNYPLSIHPWAHDAAIAAQCAAAENRFATYFHAIYHDSGIIRVDASTARKLAGASDSTSFARCMANPAVMASIRADSLDGNHLGIAGTPLVIINGRVFQGAPGLLMAEDAVDRSLAEERRP